MLQDPGSSHAKCYENDAKIAARGRLWEHIGVLESLLERPWAQFARHFGGCGWYFRQVLQKSVTLRFRSPSVVELLLLAIWATKLELLGHKSRAQAPKSRLGRASQRGQDSQVRPVCAVWLSELWKPSRISRKPSRSCSGTKVAPERPKVASDGQVRGVRTVKSDRSVRSGCRSYGTQAEIKRKSPELRSGKVQSLSS